MTTNEKLVTKSSVEKMVARAEANLAKWNAEKEKAKEFGTYDVAAAGIWRGINRATESLELANRLLAAVNEGKKVYKSMRYSTFKQDSGSSYASYRLSDKKVENTSYCERSRTEHEEVKQLARDLRKLIPSHKFRVKRDCIESIIVDEEVQLNKIAGMTIEDFKNAIVKYCQEEK